MYHKIIVKSIVFLSLASLVLASGCKKEEEDTGYLEPIKIVLPATNPSTIQKGNKLTYKIECTMDYNIDSVMVFAQPDSAAVGYNAAADTNEINKVVFPENQQSTIVVVEGEYEMPTNMVVGSKIHMRFYLRAKSKERTKILTLNVI